jgi:hypothetical protein
VADTSASTKANAVKGEWYNDPAILWSFLSGIGSIAAVIVASIAFVSSHRDQSEQRLRQKREELRGVLEKLISFREEFGKLGMIRYDHERASASSLLNVKRSIYLEAAESIAEEISSSVGPSEYYVIGFENIAESDIVSGLNYYKKAAGIAHKTSNTKQSEIWRSLAGTYYRKEPGVFNVPEGRKAFEMAVKAVKDASDYYSIYVRALCFRDWGAAEAWSGNFNEAKTRLDQAYD